MPGTTKADKPAKADKALKVKKRKAEDEPAAVDKKSKRSGKDKDKDSKDKKAKKSDAKSKDKVPADAIAAIAPAAITCDQPAPTENTSPAKPAQPQVISVSEAAPAGVDLSLDAHGLSAHTLQALKARGVTALFPIQAASYAHISAGKDVLGRARTGTGKTLAFALPMIERLLADADAAGPLKRGRRPRVLVMAPTRELALQVSREFDTLLTSSMRSVCVYGAHAMREGVDIVVGTPGRIIDHIKRGNLKLDALLFICMDEADQMVDIGFKDAMDSILEDVKTQKASIGDAAPTHQTLLFSATVPAWVNEAIKKYMKPDKVTIDLIGNQTLKASELIKHYAIPSTWQNRSNVIGDIVVVYGRGGRTIIFVETKKEANELALNDKLQANVQVIHGDIAQAQREITLKGFRNGKFGILIATNVMARGLDIPEVDLVINAEPPSDVETYIHRCGRTGRAGKEGACVTFYKSNQEYCIKNIERRAGLKFLKKGVPQPMEIVASKAFETLAVLKNEIHPSVFQYFTEEAQQVLDHYSGDAVKALSGALAFICKTTKPLPSRSLLTAAEGFRTLYFKTAQPIRNPGYIRSIFRPESYPGVDANEDMRTWRLVEDMCGAVVDVKDEKVTVEEDSEGNVTRVMLGVTEWRDGSNVQLVVPKNDNMPTLLDRDSNSGGGGNGGGYQGRNGGGGGWGNRQGGGGSWGGNNRNSSYGGGRGGSRGGYGGGRGGYGGRGGGGGSSRGGRGGYQKRY